MLDPDRDRPRRLGAMHLGEPYGVGVPQPPPPGVSMRRTSPAFIRSVHLSASRSAHASLPPGRSQFSPGAPGSPPARPYGRDTRRSVMRLTVTSSSMSTSRSIPSPPGCRAVPPLPDRSR
jgi:hypothetical protein